VVTTVGRIVARQKAFSVEPAADTQFTLDDEGPADPRLVLREAGWSLYSLDAAGRKALFVQLPPGIDLGAVPFAYATQFDRAERALRLDFETLTGLADGLPDPPGPVFIFSIGRCGSTLLSRMLGEVPGVFSLSEPDAPTNLAAARAVLRADEKAALARAVARLLYRPPAGTGRLGFVVKFRSFSIFDMAPWITAFPEARHLFLWRDAAGWANSMHMLESAVFPGADLSERAFLDMRWDLLTAGSPRAAYARYDDIDRPNGGRAEGLAALWALSMEQFLAARADGLPLLPLSYAALNGERSVSVARLLEACGLPAGAAPRVMRAYERHSQDDSLLADVRHMEPLPPAQRARVLAVLEGHPALDLG
jgi:hypothetical protein